MLHAGLFGTGDGMRTHEVDQVCFVGSLANGFLGAAYVGDQTIIWNVVAYVLKKLGEMGHWSAQDRKRRSIERLA